MSSKLAAGGETADHRSLTEGPIIGGLFAFALPTLVANVLQSFHGSINAMWVGRLLGTTGLAATSNANLIILMIFSLIFGFGMATTILVGQNMGKRDLAAVRRTMGAGISLFLFIGIFGAIAGWLCMPALLHLLGTPADAYPQALVYSRVVLLGLPAGLLLVFLQMALRGTGDSLTPLLFIIPSALIDIGLNPILILGTGPAPKMGIAGSATAGIIANYISLLLLLVYIYARDLSIRLRGPELRYLIPARQLLLTIIRMGIPIGLQMIVMSVASLVMMGLVNREGTSTVAAYGAVNQLWVYIQMPGIAIGTAVSAMAAQNIGADRWDRIDRIAGSAVAMNVLLTGLLLLSVTLSDRFVLGLFLGGDTAAIAIAHHINVVAGWGFVLFAITMVLTAIPRANGTTVGPLVIITLAIIPGRLGAVYALQPTIGSNALWWSFPVGAFIAMILTIGYYRFGGWRQRRILVATSREEAKELVQIESEPAARIHPASLDAMPPR